MKLGKNQNTMKLSNLKIYIMLFMCVIFCGVMLNACNKSASYEKLSSECVRIHIRANSNEDCDQEVKLKVRDKVTTYLTNELDGCKSKSDAIDVLNRQQDKLIEIANQTLKENGFKYQSSCHIGEEYFPQKVYGDYVFPQGDYDALILNLGTGDGNNWWCVAFPPLCFVPESDSSEQVVYKSWVKEKLDDLFN